MATGLIERWPSRRHARHLRQRRQRRSAARLVSSVAIVSAVWFTSTSWQPDEFSHLTRGSPVSRFRANEVRLQLSVLAYNLVNLWRRLVLPMRIDAWSLTSLQHRLVKTGGRLVKHARYGWLLLAKGHLTRRLFGAMLQRIWVLPVLAS